MARDVGFVADILVGGHAFSDQHYMEARQVSQEYQSAQIEEACNTDKDLKLNKQDSLIECVMTFLRRYRSRGQIVQHKAIGHIVHQAHEEHAYDQSEEQKVVLFTDTVVEPDAVVIEFVHTTIAFATVLGCIGHCCLANIALKVIICAVKFKSIFNSK